MTPVPIDSIAALFANPSAQSGGASALIAEARELLSRAGIEHRLVHTAPAGGTVELVREAIEERGARLVVAMGGDGTFAEVAKGILRSDGARDVAMGILPTGTANDQGKSYGLEAGAEQLERNVAVIAEGHATLMDVGHIKLLDAADRVAHSDLFFDSASVGFGAAVLRTRNRDREAVREVPLLGEIYRDQLVYTGALLKHLADSYVSPVKFDLEARLDGELRRYSSVLDVVVSNTPVFAGEWVLDRDARADDGLFEVLPIAGRRDFTSKLIATLRGLPFGEEDLRELGIEHSRPVRAASITLTIKKDGSGDPPPAQIDGEELPAGDKFQIEVLPRLLRLIVPRTER